MADTGLFNPGFLGSGFTWWIGQIVDDTTWRENLNPEKFETTDEIPAWGYRYKVRIMGNHDADEESIPSENLPWAGVMYPVTAGGGQGGSYQTPGLKQGNFVFGFFMDGQDAQVPIIMGVLGNNAKTKLERRTGSEVGGGKNFTPQSFYAKNEEEEPETQKKVADHVLAPGQAGNGAYASPSKENVTKECLDAQHLTTSADDKKDEVLNEKHCLSCPDPNRQSDMKNIQTVTENLTQTTEKFQRALNDAKAAGSLPIVKLNKDVSVEIDKASKECSKYMKGIMNQVQQKTTDEFNNQLQPMVNLAVPSYKNKILKEKIDGLEKIACAFNGINAGLAGMIGAALMNAFKKKKKAARTTPPVGIGTALGSTRANNGMLETFIPGPNGNGEWTATEELPKALDTPGSDVLPPLPNDGYYSTDPLCSTEELIGEVLGSNINTIMSAYDAAAAPVINTIKQSLGGTVSEAGSEGTGSINNAINENNVLAALSSGDLVGSMSSTMAEQAGVKSNIIGPVTNAFIQGNFENGMRNFLDLAGVNTNANSSAISNALTALRNGDMLGGFSAVSGILGVDGTLMQGIGGAFDAIKTGDTAALLGAAGGLAAMYPSILNAIAGKGAALAGPDLGNLLGGLGASGGMAFDIASSLSFVQSITQLYDCDPQTQCSPNDVHTMQGGGHSADSPSAAEVAKNAGG